MKAIRNITAVLALTYITLNLTFWMLPLLILAFLKLMIPARSVKNSLYGMMLRVYMVAVRIDDFLFKKLMGIRFEVSGLDGLESDKNYLVIANHRSWADILVLQSLLIGVAPIIKFIVKREILYVPLVGLICWAYEYPLVKRSAMKSQSRKRNQGKMDLDVINRRLGNLGRHPTTIINFVEGTRFNLLKSKKSESSYRHLLNPRAGGLTYILNTFGSRIDYVLDFTIAYHTREPVFWNFLGGACRRVSVDVQMIPMQEMLEMIDPGSDKPEYPEVATWLNGYWEGKDRKMDSFLTAANRPG